MQNLAPFHTRASKTHRFFLFWPEFLEEAGMEKSGKTLELVRRLPAEPLMLVVHSAAMREYVRRMIGDVRGAEFLKGVRVEVIVRMHDTDRMLGYRDRVFIDHAVWDTLPGGVLSKIEILASGCNARHPKLPA